VTVRTLRRSCLGYLLPASVLVHGTKAGAYTGLTGPVDSKEVVVSKKTHEPSAPGWVQVVIGLSVAIAAAAGAGHNGVTRPQPPTVCVQARVLLQGAA
jgi:hypothetical protein